MISARADQRKAIKVARANLAESRRRRETRTMLRKQKKEDKMSKRRTRTPAASASQPATMESTGAVATTPTVAGLPQIMTSLRNPGCTEQNRIQCVKNICRMLSVEHNPPVHQVVESGAMKLLVQYMSDDEAPADLVFETAWALADITSTDLTNSVVENGVVSSLIKHMRNDNADIREQCYRALGNIAGNNPADRDSLLRQQVLAPMILDIEQTQNLSFLANVTEAISKLCSGKPEPSLEIIQEVIKPLTCLLVDLECKKDVKVHAVWGLSCISGGEDGSIQKVMESDSDITPTLVGLLEHTSSEIVASTVQCLGNFVTGNDMQTQTVLNAGVLKHAKMLLERPQEFIKQQTCWLLSNIAAGTHDQIDKLRGEREVMSTVIGLASDASWKIRKEALYVICNAAISSNDYHAVGLVELNAFQPLCEALPAASHDEKVLMVLLDTFEKFMEVSTRGDHCWETIIDEHDGIGLLEGLRVHSSDNVRLKVVALLEKFFQGEEVVGDENIAPAQVSDSGGNLTFGVSKELSPSSGNGASDGSPMFNFVGPAGTSPFRGLSTNFHSAYISM